MSEASPASGIVVLPHTARAPAPADPRQMRVMPVAESILWSPTVGGTHRPAPLMFFAQQTLRKIQDRLGNLPNGLGIGLLTGRRCADSRPGVGSGAQFVLIDGALPLPALASEDEATDALSEGMRTAAAGIEVFGWYRSHSFSDAALTPGDVEAQSELFADRPCVVMVVAAGGEAGAIFRSSTNPAWPVEALPFYEWLAERAVTDGPKPTLVGWRNYRAAETVIRLATPGTSLAAVQPADHGGPAFLMPDGRLDDDDAPVDGAPWYRRFGRAGTYAAAALGGAIVVATLAAIINAGGSTGARAGSDSGSGRAGLDAVASTAAVAQLDRRADTLALALTAFEDRSRMFDARQMPCTGLSRGLQQVEDGWLGYNIARKEVLTPDATRDARDRSLYAGVRTAERNFERSGCARP